MLDLNPDYFTIEQMKQAGLWPQQHLPAYAMFPYINRLKGDLVGAEIGVLKGENVHSLLENCPRIQKLYGVDFYQKHTDYGSEKTEEDMEKYESVATENLSQFGDRYKLIKADSKDAVNQIEEPLDFVLIDGDHTPEGIFYDLETYYHKVKSGGYIFIRDTHIPSVMEGIKRFQKEHKIRLPLNRSKNNVSFLAKNLIDQSVVRDRSISYVREKGKMEKIYDLITDNKLSSLLDVGANLGRFSQQIKLQFNNMELFMIEANEKCKDSLERTDIPYVITCLSDTEKEVEFFLEDTNDVGTGASYYLEKTRFYSQKRSIKLKTKRLDDLIEEKFGPDKSFDIIKLDTQGSEIDIMEGGQKTLERSKFVIAETSLVEYNENSPTQEEFFRYMESIGFKPKEKIEYHYHEGKLIQEDWIFER